MEAKRNHPRSRSRAIVSTPPVSRLDAMTPRPAGEVLAILRAAAPQSEGRVPIGMWKTGWLAQPGGAA